MAESKGDSSSRDAHRCRANCACCVSFASLLICTVALIRVETVSNALRDLQGGLVEIQCSHKEPSAVKGPSESGGHKLDLTQSVVNRELRTGSGVETLTQGIVDNIK